VKRLAWIILLLVPLLLVTGAWYGLHWLQTGEAGAKWLLARAERATGGQLVVGASSGTLHDGLVIENLEWNGDGAHISVGRIGLRLEASLWPRRVDVRQLRASSVRIQSGLVASAGESTIADVLRGLVLPWDITLQVDDAVVEGLGWSHRGADTLKEGRLSLSGRWNDRIALESATFSSEFFDGDISGEVELVSDLSASVEVGGTVSARGTGETLVDGLRLHLEGDEARLEVDAVATRPAATAQGGIVDPFGDWRVALESSLPEWRMDGENPVVIREVITQVEGRHDDWATRISGVLAATPVSGRFEIEANGNLDGAQLDTFTLDGELAELQGSGQISWVDHPALDAVIEAGRISPWHAWQGWPENAPLSGNVALRYVDGVLDVSDGALRDGSDGEVTFSATHDFDGSHTEAEAQWQSLRWPPTGGGAPMVVSDGAGTVTGKPDDWHATAAFGIRTPDHPQGQVRLDAQGDRHGARVRQFGGEALGGRFEGHGSVGWRDNPVIDVAWTVDQVDLGAVVSDLPMVVSADGELVWNMADERARLSVPRLGGMVEGQPFSGRVTAVLGPEGWALPEFDLVAERLQFQDIVVHNLSVAPAAGETDVMRLQAGPLEKGDQVVDFAHLELDYGRQDPRLEWVITRDRLRLDGRAEMAPVTGQPGRWGGTLQALELHQEDEQLVRLRTPAELGYGDARFEASALCLDFSLSGGLCANTVRVGAGAVELAVSLEQVPLALAEWLWDYNLRLTQVVDGNFYWRRGEGLPTGNAHLVISAGEIADSGGSESIQTGNGLVSFVLQDGMLRSGIIALPLPGTGAIDAEFEIAGLALDGTGRVSGRLRSNIDDVTVLESLLPGIDGVDGRLSVDLGVSGVVADPKLDGFVRIEQGRFDMPALGLEIRNLALDGEVSSQDLLVLRGGFVAGDGQGELEARINYAQADNLAGQLHIGGERLLLADLPDLQVRVDPDMTIAWRRNRWLIDGEVVIPHARVSPSSEFQARTGESADVRVVAGSKPGEQPQSVSEPLSLEGELMVRLGEDVRFDSDLASGRLQGTVGLTWNGQAMPVASGAVDVFGDVRAYGPVLRLDDAHVRFPDVALNNPVLDIRAEREIYGNTQVRSAGVFISGTARRPDVEAYTRPFTTEERAWTLLITGSDIDYSQGIGAFDIGTYIAPRLYLSYGISLFDNENVVGIRYDLKKGFGIKATTGEHESGIDASYTFDH